MDKRLRTSSFANEDFELTNGISPSNLALVFAGGRGTRSMANGGLPKQFLELHGKPILIYTLEHFERHDEIDGIIVVCIESWIPAMRQMLHDFGITKVVDIVPGGKTSQDSIYNGLCIASRRYSANSIVLVHDGVRPLIDSRTISDNLAQVREFRSCITAYPATETVLINNDTESFSIPDRSKLLLARAPQGFLLKDLVDAHELARQDNRHDFVDTCSLMHSYGYPIHTIIGRPDNIKITTPMDYFIFKAIVEINSIQNVLES